MWFNIGKCKVMHFGRANQSYDYQMSSSKLEVVTEEKDLGVWISQDLKVSQHCLQAYSKANKLAYLEFSNVMSNVKILKSAVFL